MKDIGFKLCIILFSIAFILNAVNFVMNLNSSDSYDSYDSDSYESEYSTQSQFNNDNTTQESSHTYLDDDNDYYTPATSKDSDPYDVNYYENGDDFAEEWAEEFGSGDSEDGYEDAYDYWESESGEAD